MGYKKYFKKNMRKKNRSKEMRRKRIMKLRREPTTVKLDKPTNITRARSLGYKAKKGYFVIRQRVSRGGRQRPKFKGGRRSVHRRRKKVVNKSYRQIAEERAAKERPNCEVLNSYKLASDGNHYWFEIILVDRMHPEVLADPQLKKATRKRGRAERGLTSAGKKSRGLRKKGKGAEKIR